MKLLIFTDLHNSKKAVASLRTLVRSKNPDALVCCGDISIFELNLERVIKEIVSLKKPIIMVHGNHEDDSHMRKLCKKYPSIRFIHKQHLIVEDVLFLGYGGDGFSHVDREFEALIPKFEKIIKKEKLNRVVLITHAPPHGTKQDRILGGHCGNKSIRKFIEKMQPTFSFCGHIHENFGRIDKIKKTVVINPGPFGKIVKL